MRKNFIVCAFLLAAMIITPLIAMNENRTTAVSAEPVKNDDDGSISVMLTENGKVEDMDMREYIIGAVAAEMDVEYQEEALKAQAVACHTYADYQRQKENSELNGADISDNSDEFQGYIDKDARKKKWGDNFEIYEKKISCVVDSVADVEIYYKNEPIMAVYHDICCGHTLSAKEVWGEEIPYLESVQSPGDKLSTDYLKTVSLSYDEFKSNAEKIDSVSFDGKAEEWLGDVTKNDSGFVSKIEIGGREISGKDFKNAFSLRSNVFSVAYESEKIVINTTGNGHMVGMSQYGADYMSRQGADYKEILNHYYTNVELK